MRLKNNEKLDSDARVQEALQAMASAREEIGMGNEALLRIKVESETGVGSSTDGKKPELTPEVLVEEPHTKTQEEIQKEETEKEIELCMESLRKSPKTVHASDNKYEIK